MDEKERAQNLEEQDDEITVLKSMFENDIKMVAKNQYSIRLSIEDNKETYIDLRFYLNQFYPSQKPPDLQITSPFFEIKGLKEKLLKMFKKEEVVVFEWVNYIQEKKFSRIGKIKKQIDLEKPKYEILVSDVVSKKKSKFVAHGTKVESKDDVKIFINYLKGSSKKIMNATHNMYAYRLLDYNVEDKESYDLVEKKVDNGEKGGGDVILTCLRFKGIVGFCVCVTRWYGGIHLGGDRFKIIKNLSNELIGKYLIKSKEESDKK